VDQHNLVLNIPRELEEGLYSGGVELGGAEYIQSILHKYISFNESISLTLNPIYYLEPNTIIYVNRQNISIVGDYTIETFNIPLDVKSQMTIQCKRNLEMITSTTNK
jgi:hypothetical protein